MEYVLPKDISENVSNLEEIEKAIKKIINNEKIDVKNKLLSKHIKNSQANNYSHYIKNTLLNLNKLRDAEDKFNSKSFLIISN